MKQIFLLALLCCTGVISACSDLEFSLPSAVDAPLADFERDRDDNDGDDEPDSRTQEREQAESVAELCSRARAVPKSHPGHDC